MFLKISQNSQENACARIPFFNKVAGAISGRLLLKRSNVHILSAKYFRDFKPYAMVFRAFKEKSSVREDRNLNYCDVIALEILTDHKCQWPQDSLNCESLKYRSWNIVLNFTYFNCKIANISMMYRHWAIFS